MNKIKNIITLTDKAIKQLRKMDKPDHILQFSVKGGGCVGMKQDLKYIPKNKLDNFDEIVKVKDKNGELAIAIDKMSIINLIGTTIDYEDDLISSGFKIDNPNVEKKCGCGESVMFRKSDNNKI